MQVNGISDKVILRLPRYYRFLGELSNEGIEKISSGELAKRMGLTASQIRQDLNCFGGFGQQGYGYHTDMLRKEIGAILGMDKPKKIILIGLGNLGNAVATHMNFTEKGFELIGIFDKKESLIGRTVRDISVRSIENLDDFCCDNKPNAAILCIPKNTVPEIAERLIKQGVTAFLNFSHYDIALNYEGVVVENVHIGDSLMRLSYDIKNMNN